MTRAEYMEMADLALARYEHLLYTFPRDTNIVFVVSRDVYLAMISYEVTNIQVNFATGVNAAYHGAPICCINEDSEDFFLPVVYSQHFHHHDGVQVGDFVLFNDEDDDLLYRLVRLTPEAMYTDTGLTVSFIDDRTPTRNHADAVAAVAANAATETNLAVDTATTAVNAIAHHPDPWEYVGIPAVDYDAATIAVATDDLAATGIIGTFEPAATFVADRVNNDPFVARINEEVLEQLAGWRPQYMGHWQTEAVRAEPARAKRKRAEKEKELNPGDTALLDEYLNSYLRSGA